MGTTERKRKKECIVGGDSDRFVGDEGASAKRIAGNFQDLGKIKSGCSSKEKVAQVYYRQKRARTLVTRLLVEK